MNSKIIKSILVLFTLSFVVSPLVFAQIPDLSTTGSDTIPGSKESYTFTNLVSTANKTVNIFVSILVVLAVLYMVWGGFTYITAGGDSGKIGEAKNRVLFGLIGVVIMIFAVGIFNLVSSYF